MRIERKHYLLEFSTETYWKYREHSYNVTLISLVPTRSYFVTYKDVWQWSVKKHTDWKY